MRAERRRFPQEDKGKKNAYRENKSSEQEGKRGVGARLFPQGEKTNSDRGEARNESIPFGEKRAPIVSVKETGSQGRGKEKSEREAGRTLGEERNALEKITVDKAALNQMLKEEREGYWVTTEEEGESERFL